MGKPMACHVRCHVVVASTHGSANAAPRSLLTYPVIRSRGKNIRTFKLTVEVDDDVSNDETKTEAESMVAICQGKGMNGRMR